MRVVAMILALALAAGAPGGSADEADRLVAQLSSPDRAEAARAESRLIAMGKAATPALGRYLGQEHPDARGMEAALRVIARGGDVEALRLLWPEWERSPALRDNLIGTWAAFGEACISPLAGYFAGATAPQQEKIIEAIAPFGEPAVPALKGMRAALAEDTTGVAGRLRGRIDEMIQAAPVVTLSRRGAAALPDLERIAKDPAASEASVRAALRGLSAIAAGPRGDEATQALRRVAVSPLAPALHDEVVAMADDAWLMMLGRKGEAAAQEYVAILVDPAAREPLKMGAVNGLYGMGAIALPIMDKLAPALKAGPVKDYLLDLSSALRAAAPPAAPATAPPAAPPEPAGPACSGDSGMQPIAHLDTGGLPISPRWFRRTQDRAHIVYTTVESGYYRLVTAGADGTASITLGPVAHQFAPDVSWNGSRLVFLGTDDQPGRPILRNDVYTTSWAGKDLRKITPAPGMYSSPVWLTNRDDIVFARNALDVRDPNGRVMAEAALMRSPDAAGATRELARLPDQIITAIESSPDVLRLALLAWKVEAPASAASIVSEPTVYLASIDGGVLQPVALGLAQGGPGRWSRKLTAAEALAIGGDLTWSADGRKLTAGGRLINAQSAQIEARVDPGNDSYTARLASRSLLTEGDTCLWFNDSKQVCKRCLAEPAVQILADCRGALLWHDEKRNALALFDPLSGDLGFVPLPKRRPPAPVPGAGRPGTSPGKP